MPVMDVLNNSFLFLANVGLNNSKKYIRYFHVHRFFVPQANQYI